MPILRRVLQQQEVIVVEQRLRVRVVDNDTKEVREYALSRDNWRHEWAACTDAGGIVMWVPEGLMNEKVVRVVTSGRTWSVIHINNSEVM